MKKLKAIKRLSDLPPYIFIHLGNLKREQLAKGKSERAANPGPEGGLGVLVCFRWTGRRLSKTRNDDA